jgi:hypothetical protein
LWISVKQSQLEQTLKQMPQDATQFRILIIDDDSEMSATMEDLLKGHRAVRAAGIQVFPTVDRVDVIVESEESRPGCFRLKRSTLDRLLLLSRLPRYHLILVDYGFASDTLKDILWGRDRDLRPSPQEVMEKMPTLKTLRRDFDDLCHESNQNLRHNVFSAAKRVLLRSFTSDFSVDSLGTFSEKLAVTQDVFPNAEIIPFDSRQEIYAGNKFYELYTHPRGRAFYRQIALAYTQRVVETEMMRRLVELAGKQRVKRSIFNIAAFGGLIAVIGSIVQFVAGVGLQYLERGAAVGWAPLALSVIILVGGSMLMAFWFERLAKTLVAWTGSSEQVDVS